MRKKNILLLTISSFLIIGSSFSQITEGPLGGGNQPIIDRIVAQVGENIVLHSDIEVQKLQAMQEGYKLDLSSECRILEEMLYQNLLIHQAGIDSVVVSDAQVDDEMENRLRNIEMQIGSREKLEEFYGKTYDEIKNEFREVIRDRLIAQKMEQTITQDVAVTPRDVERLFKEIPEDSLPMVNEQVSIQQIVVFPKVSQRAKSAAITQLEKWRNDIIRGTRSFEAVATINSDDPGSAKQGGRIEASRGMMVKPFESAVFSLNVGDISEVVETEYGFHIIQLIDRKGDDYVVRHILKMPEVDRSAFTLAAAIIDECSGKIQSGEMTWEEAVLVYSEDENSKQNQGTVINPYSGELHWDIEALNEIDQALYAEIARMDIGGVSQPMIYTDQQRRKEGVRIVRLRDRTQPHRANLKDDYTVIKKAAENRKKENAIEEWVNATIPSAYVRIDEKYSRCDYLYNW